MGAQPVVWRCLALWPWKCSVGWKHARRYASVHRWSGRDTPDLGTQDVHHRPHTEPFSIALWATRGFTGAWNKRRPKQWYRFFSGKEKTWDDTKKPPRSELPAISSLSGGCGVVPRIQAHITVVHTPASMRKRAWRCHTWQRLQCNSTTSTARAVIGRMTMRNGPSAVHTQCSL